MTPVMIYDEQWYLVPFKFPCDLNKFYDVDADKKVIRYWHEPPSSSEIPGSMICRGIAEAWLKIAGGSVIRDETWSESADVAGVILCDPRNEQLLSLLQRIAHEEKMYRSQAA